MSQRMVWILAALLISSAPAARVEMVLSLNKSRDYFSIPYPNELHRNDDGTVDRARFPVPLSSLLSVHYRKLAHSMEDFSPRAKS